ncbi:MAG TPA: DUF5752 family protein, partial [Synergistaceae bacterium]|nr:DUF5752 family protein [Synergistaceae bacterium]
CELLALSTGMKARTLQELRDALGTVPSSSLHYHFWGRLMRPQIGESEYNNDFAWWAGDSLGEKALAERLSVINPGDYATLEDLREDMMALLEDRMDEGDFFSWARSSYPFFFTRAQMLIFDTGTTINNPRELGAMLESAPNSSVFYHFVDARRRTPEGEDDFCYWLRQFGEDMAPLRKELGNLDPHLLSLEELQRQIVSIVENYFAFSGGE